MSTETQTPSNRSVAHKRKKPKLTASAKVTSAALAGAVATVAWTILTATVWKSTFDDTALAALVAATTTILATLFGFIRDENKRFITYWRARHVGGG